MGAYDLRTGVDFIYFNHVAKFRDISMRGPWASGGIEFNFGKMGHEPYTSAPVDWCARTNEDGSVSCFVGGTGCPQFRSMVAMAEVRREAFQRGGREIWPQDMDVGAFPSGRDMGGPPYGFGWAIRGIAVRTRIPAAQRDLLEDSVQAPVIRSRIDGFVHGAVGCRERQVGTGRA